MSNKGNALISSFMIAMGAGLLMVNNAFSDLMSFPGVDFGLPGFANFRNAGILLIVLGAFYLAMAIILAYKGSSGSGKGGNGEHVCTYCGDRLRDEDALKEHIQRFHKGESKSSEYYNDKMSQSYE